MNSPLLTSPFHSFPAKRGSVQPSSLCLPGTACLTPLWHLSTCVCVELLEHDVPRCTLPCLAFSQHPGSTVWCLSLILEILSRSISLEISILLLSLFFCYFCYSCVHSFNRSTVLGFSVPFFSGCLFVFLFAFQLGKFLLTHLQANLFFLGCFQFADNLFKGFLRFYYHV